MTVLPTCMATSKHLPTRLVAVGYRVLASRSGLTWHVAQCSLATRTMGNYIWRSWAMGRFRDLRMTRQFAGVLSAIKGATTFVEALE